MWPACVFALRLTLCWQLQRWLELHRIRPHQILQFLEQLFVRDKRGEKTAINPTAWKYVQQGGLLWTNNCTHTLTQNRTTTRAAHYSQRDRCRVFLWQVTGDTWWLTISSCDLRPPPWEMLVCPRNSETSHILDSDSLWPKPRDIIRCTMEGDQISPNWFENDSLFTAHNLSVCLCDGDRQNS